VCIGQNTHKVLQLETISKDDDNISQRHELIGVKRIYEKFDEKVIPVRQHAHDNNASVSKYVREQRRPTHNSKDTWHANKGTTREVKQITSGRQYFEGKTREC
jgi:hypothetical protein